MTTQDQNKKTLRNFQCRDYLWELFEQMSGELECSTDYLINEAMRQYARSRNYGTHRRDTGSPLPAHPASSTAIPSLRDNVPMPRAETPMPTTLRPTRGNFLGAVGPARPVPSMPPPPPPPSRPPVSVPPPLPGRASAPPPERHDRTERPDLQPRRPADSPRPRPEHHHVHRDRRVRPPEHQPVPPPCR